MPETRLGLARLGSIVGLSALTLGIGLAGSGRLTYHEAFVAQAARELIARGAVLIPTIGGLPWLEKPPLAFWLVALAGKMLGGVDETVARLPSAVAATLLAIGLAVFTARRFGRDVGWLAGLVQASTFWFVVRGRLAEADVILACLVTWTLVAFDRLRTQDWGLRTGASGDGLRGPHKTLGRRAFFARSFSPLALGERPGVRGVASPVALAEGLMVDRSPCRAPHPGPDPEREGVQKERAIEPALASFPWRWAFFAGLGATALVKGLGFGAVLVGSVVAVTLIWDRDRSMLRALKDWRGWALAGVLAMTWPVLVLIRLPSAASLWALHVTDRMASHPEHFIGGPWWQYGPAVLGQALPWTPLALAGAWPSLVRATRGRGRGGVDRLLWAWSVVPVLVLSTATVKNAHYAIHALPPLASWSALGLAQVGGRLVVRRGWSIRRVRVGAAALFVGLGLACGLGHLWLGPRFDRRASEWDWCGRVGRSVEPGVPLVVLYEDWDRKPYPTPFGPVPHDWAVRLFYLGRPASWRQGAQDLLDRPPTASSIPYALIARERDVPALREIGRVETQLRGPSDRFDREFTLYRITPAPRRTSPRG